MWNYEIMYICAFFLISLSWMWYPFHLGVMIVYVTDSFLLHFRSADRISLPPVTCPELNIVFVVMANLSTHFSACAKHCWVLSHKLYVVQHCFNPHWPVQSVVEETRAPRNYVTCPGVYNLCQNWGLSISDSL